MFCPPGDEKKSKAISEDKSNGGSEGKRWSWDSWGWWEELEE
jgi:hypothetical protein